MNFQDVIRNVYDDPTKTLGVRFGGVGNSIVTVANTVPVTFSGNVTLSDSKTYIGLTSTTLGAGDRYIGLVTNTPVGLHTLAPSPNYIGLVSISHAAWADPKTYIGLVTNTPAAVDTKVFIGLVTTQAADPKGFIGLTTVVQASSARTITGNLTLTDSKTYIGLATVTLDNSRNIGVLGNLTLSDPKTYIGLTTSTLGVGTQFIGLVTAWNRNAGSAKTLTPYALNLSTSSVVTIAVPTNAQSMYISNGVISSDATVRISIKSGVTYLTGNASIGVSLNPGGGYVLIGSPDSPSWIGLPSGALVIEKFDMTGTKANVGGNLITFTE